jgi:hypothetical protein
MPAEIHTREHNGKEYVHAIFEGDATPAESAEIMPVGIDMIKNKGLTSAIFDMRAQTSIFPMLDIYEQHTMLASLLPPGFKIVVVICPQHREYTSMAREFARKAGLDYNVTEDMDEALALATC